ncbi:hypothetical protein AB0F45_19825 [Streptomyces achromogenes]|uniref:hypothetical protein n=1 Tax=Streptomyces achromogenes TaxID=67255 RepID=UPI0033F044C0
MHDDAAVGKLREVFHRHGDSVLIDIGATKVPDPRRLCVEEIEVGQHLIPVGQEDYFSWRVGNHEEFMTVFAIHALSRLSEYGTSVGGKPEGGGRTT